MSAFDDIFNSIKPFTFHKMDKKMKRMEKLLGPPPLLTEEERAEEERVSRLIEHWAKTGKVFTIPDQEEP